MDECNDEDVQDLVASFTQITEQAGSTVDVCLSSRYLPQVPIAGCYKIIVEQHRGDTHCLLY